MPANQRVEPLSNYPPRAAHTASDTAGGDIRCVCTPLKCRASRRIGRVGGSFACATLSTSRTGGDAARTHERLAPSAPPGSTKPDLTGRSRRPHAEVALLMALDVVDLPSAAAQLADLSPAERQVLGCSPRAWRHGRSPSDSR